MPSSSSQPVPGYASGKPSPHRRALSRDIDNNLRRMSEGQDGPTVDNPRLSRSRPSSRPGSRTGSRTADTKHNGSLYDSVGSIGGRDSIISSVHSEGKGDPWAWASRGRRNGRTSGREGDDAGNDSDSDLFAELNEGTKKYVTYHHPGWWGVLTKMWQQLTANWGTDRMASRVFLRFTQPALEDRYMSHLMKLRTTRLRFLAVLSMFFMAIFYINDIVSYSKERAAITFYIRFCIAVPLEFIVVLMTWSKIYREHFELITLIGSVVFTPFVAVIGALGNAGAPLVVSLMIFIAFTQILIIRSAIIHATLVILVHNVAYLSLRELPLDQLAIQNLMMFTFVALGLFSAYKSELRARSNFLYLWQSHVTKKHHRDQLNVTGDLLRSLIPAPLANRMLHAAQGWDTADPYDDDIPVPIPALTGKRMDRIEAFRPGGRPTTLQKMGRLFGSGGLLDPFTTLAPIEVDYVVALVLEVANPQPLHAQGAYLKTPMARKGDPGIKLVNGSTQNLLHAIMVGVEHAAISNDIAFFAMPHSKCLLVSGLDPLQLGGPTGKQRCSTMLHVAGVLKNVADALAKESEYTVDCRFGLGAGGPAYAGIFVLNDSWVSDVLADEVELAGLAAECAQPSQVLVTGNAYSNLQNIQGFGPPMHCHPRTAHGMRIQDEHDHAVGGKHMFHPFPLGRAFGVQPGQPVRASDTMANLPALSARSTGMARGMNWQSTKDLSSAENVRRPEFSRVNESSVLRVSSVPGRLDHAETVSRVADGEPVRRNVAEAAVVHSPNGNSTSAKDDGDLKAGPNSLGTDTIASNSGVNNQYGKESLQNPFPEHPWLFETDLLQQLPSCHRFPALRAPAAAPEPLEIQTHPFTLVFDDPYEEQEFRTSFVSDDPRLFQMVVLTTLLSVLVHGLQDYVLVRDEASSVLRNLLILRYAVEVPVIAAYLFYLQSPLFPRYHRLFTTLYAVILSGSTTTLLLLVETEVRTYYTASIVRVMTNLYSGLRLRILGSSSLAWVLFAVIELLIWIVFAERFTFVERTYTTSFLLVTLFFGMLFVHQMEESQRRGYLVRKSLVRATRVNYGERGVSSRLSSALYPGRYSILLRSVPAVSETFGDQPIMSLTVSAETMTQVRQPGVTLRRMYQRLSEAAADQGLHLMRGLGLNFVLVGRAVRDGRIVSSAGKFIYDSHEDQFRGAARLEAYEMIRCAIALRNAIAALDDTLTIKCGIAFGPVFLFASGEFGQHSLDITCPALDTAQVLSTNCCNNFVRITQGVRDLLAEGGSGLDASFTDSATIRLPDSEGNMQEIMTMETALNVLAPSLQTEKPQWMAELSSRRDSATPLGRSWTRVELWKPTASQPRSPSSSGSKLASSER